MDLTRKDKFYKLSKEGNISDKDTRFALVDLEKQWQFIEQLVTEENKQVGIFWIKKEDCEHLQSISSYNNNYYKLPVSILGCNIIYEDYDNLSEDFNGNKLGILTNGKFEEKLYIHQPDCDKEFLIDLEELSVTNSWI